MDLMETGDIETAAVMAGQAFYVGAPARSPKAMNTALLAETQRLQRQLDQARATILRHETRIAQLETLSTTDELTGLQNRRGFFRDFETELDRCGRGLSPGGLLVLIDLDNFKAINDTYGHAAGDACLRLVGRTLEETIRPMDSAARFGGDEFILLLSGAGKKSAADRIQKVAWTLNRLTLAWQGGEIAIHASVGIQEYGPGACAESIFRDADLAMYAKKKQRREDVRAGQGRSQAS